MKHLRPYQTPSQYLGELFDICANRHQGNEMSVQANKIAHEGKGSNRRLILQTLRDDFAVSNYGLICEDLERITGLSHQTCSARLSELRREGKIKIVGQRKTRSGSPASIYQAL